MLLEGKRDLFPDNSDVRNSKIVLYWIAVAYWYAFGRLVSIVVELLTVLWTLKVWDRGVQDVRADSFRAHSSTSKIGLAKSM